MLLKIDFISSGQPIKAKFAELRETATTFVHAQNFCKLRQIRFVDLMSRQIYSKAMKRTQCLPQVKNCGTSGKCDSLDLTGELRRIQTAIVCLLNV